jgi:hypothetical protein
LNIWWSQVAAEAEVTLVLLAEEEGVQVAYCLRLVLLSLPEHPLL